MPRRTDISLILLGVGALLLSQAARIEASMLDPARERTVQALAACGVPATNIRISYEDELQSELVSISDLGGADEARFRCLWDATFPSYLVDVSAASQREAYQAFERRVGARLARAEARDWLAKAGLLDRVPRYDPRKGVKAFARALEAACGLRAGTAFETYGTSGLTIRRSFFGDSLTTDNHDEFACLLRMESASNAEEHGLMLTFIGNGPAEEGDR